MKSNWVNNTHVEGYIFSHSLQARITGDQSKNPGTPFIQGIINVATDNDGMNVVPVSFTYVTERYSRSGKENATYKVLQQILSGTQNTFEEVGTSALKVRIDGDVEINDFLGRDGNMVAAKRVRGSFCHLANDVNFEASFETDMLIAETVMQEVEDGEDYMNVRGYAFNFRGDLLPVTYSINNPDGIKYFENCDISNNNPLLTRVWGNIISTTIETKNEVESAFGGPQVNITTRTLRSWQIAGCAAEPYEFDDDSTITRDELKVKLAERDERVAAEKKRTEDYQASRNASASAFAAPASNLTATASVSGDFKF